MRQTVCRLATSCEPVRVYAAGKAGINGACRRSDTGAWIMGQIAGGAIPLDDNMGLKNALDKLERLTSVLRKAEPLDSPDANNPVHALQAATETAFAPASPEFESSSSIGRKPRTAPPAAPTLLSMKQASVMTTLSVSSIKRMMAAGKFPRPVRLGESRIAFVDAEIHAWVRARIAERD
ncbi:MAG: transcriptional regulator [Proteobacteria bacterium]|nr:transcriptional regulator [Pseudomonadota bacterium]